MDWKKDEYQFDYLDDDRRFVDQISGYKGWLDRGRKYK